MFGAIKLLRSHSELLGLAAAMFVMALAHEALPNVFVLYTDLRYGWSESTVGAALVSLAPSTDGRSLVGDLLVIAGVGAAATYGVLASRRVHVAGPLGTALAHQVWALGLVVVIALVGGDLAQVPTDVAGLAWAAGSGILGYALPFWLYLSAVTHISAARAGLPGFTQPQLSMKICPPICSATVVPLVAVDPERGAGMPARRLR